MHKRIVSLLICAILLLPGMAALAADAPPDAQRLVVYTAHKEDVYSPIIKEFEARTGIWVSIQSGGTFEMLERISFEEEAPVCDVMFGGGVESLDIYNRYFAPPPADLAATLQSEYLLEDSNWLPFSALPMVLIYNPRLISNQPPDSWASLLDAQYAGRIAFADPSVSGSSYTGLATLLQMIPGESTLARFVANLNGKVLAGSGDVVTAVASGNCSIGVTLEETALKAIAAGKDIAMVYPLEGTSAVPDGAAIVADCPHPENAVRFIRFILGRDVQNRLMTDMYRRPVLLDIAPAALQAFTIASYDIRKASQQKPEILRQWAACLAKDDAE